MMMDAPIFSDGLWKRCPKNWGMVVESKCWVMMRVRRPNTTHTSREPKMALPMPAQVAAMPYFQPNCPA